MSQIHHFLLVYSHDEGKLVQQDEFLDEAQAAAAYTAAERGHRGSLENYEIVLVGSDSIDTIMRTHGHYFAAQDDSSPFSLALRS